VYKLSIQFLRPKACKQRLVVSTTLGPEMW
jgi:hypothetical protein